ncbi:MAG TPA: ribonuclease R [Deltaproteobacteria bacterium]|nr:ribonuclease R [Deltaproteobacteria bacterium]
MKIDSKAVLSFMESEAEGPVGLKELVRRFEVPRDRREGFKRMIKGLVAEGLLVKIRGGRLGLPSKMNLVRGTLECHPDGYGFVRPEEGGEDVFIGPRKLGGAMHGDQVVSRVEGIKPGGKREGRIIRILKRAHRTVVGRFERGKGFGVVVPADERLLYEIIIPSGRSMGAGAGRMVECEITRWPAKHMAPAGRVTAVLGDPDDPDVEIEVIVRKYELPHRFPAEVMEEAEAVPQEVTDAETEGRVDLRKKRVFTIDGETAKDFDDAVAVEETGGGGLRLYVSIADVAHYVKEGSLLDAEARSRSTSVYFPDRCIPMLPEPLSNGICSLNPGVDRLTLTAEIEFDAGGRAVKKSFYESVIRSVKRLTYRQVQQVLDGDRRAAKGVGRAVVSDLKTMAALAQTLTGRRMRSGSIDFDLPEPQIIIDMEGRIEDIVRSERLASHRLIEEFMLAANRAVAERFGRTKPFIFRVHEEPDEDKLRDFLEIVSCFGYPPGKKGTGPKAMQRILSAAEGRPEERLVNHLLLRSMKQAVYSVENIGHYGLAFRNYTHFTSPIRRYPDLVVHRLVKAALRRRRPRGEEAEERLAAVAAHASARERKAMEAEREIADLKKAQFMKDKVGMEYEGFVSGVTSFGFFVELREYFVEGLVHVTSLGDDYYIFDDKRHTLRGEHTKRSFRPGDEVKVRIEAVDLERRRIEMRLVEGAAQAGAKGRRRGRRGGRRRSP